MMRFAIIALALVLFATPCGVEAQGRTVTIGYLGNSSPSLESNAVEAFREGLRQHGYVEGQNLIIKYQWAEGQQERSAILAAELVRLKPAVILTAGTPGTLAAKQATQSIPIVTAVAGDPVASGLVSSLAKPRGNVTGLATLNEELEGKRLEIFKQVVPKLSRVAVLRNPANPFTTIAWKGTQSAAEALGIKLQPIEVRGPMTWMARSPRSRRLAPRGSYSSRTAFWSCIGRRLCNSRPRTISLACSRFGNSRRTADS